MVMSCPRYKRPCFAIECNGLRACWLEQAEQEQGKRKMARMCPSLGIYCYLKECSDNNHCSEQVRSAVADQALAAAVDKALGTIGSDKADASAFNVPHQWTCPQDKQPCQMISCNGGQTCYVEEQSKKPMSNTHYTGYKAVPPCHEGMHSLGFIGNAELMIGRESAARSWEQARDGKIGLIIGLLGDAYPQGNIVGMNDKAKGLGLHELLVTTPVVPNIWIRWPDFGVVPFDKDWWLRLLDIIDKVDGAVLLYCMGGHGRSGTAAAILCSLSGLIPGDQDPVHWVREKYCKKVVESDVQVEYIEAITGRKVHCVAAKETTYSTWKGHKAVEHYPKKKVGGNGGSKVKQKTDPSRLSKRKWKSWWRKCPRTGLYSGIADISRVSQIPDGQVFVIGKRHWRWSIKDDEFQDVTPVEAAK